LSRQAAVSRCAASRRGDDGLQHEPSATFTLNATREKWSDNLRDTDLIETFVAILTKVADRMQGHIDSPVPVDPISQDKLIAISGELEKLMAGVCVDHRDVAEADETPLSRCSRGRHSRLVPRSLPARSGPAGGSRWLLFCPVRRWLRSIR
jgi:hypothetical protein